MNRVHISKNNNNNKFFSSGIRETELIVIIAQVIMYNILAAISLGGNENAMGSKTCQAIFNSFF